MSNISRGLEATFLPQLKVPFYGSQNQYRKLGGLRITARIDWHARRIYFNVNTTTEIVD